MARRSSPGSESSQKENLGARRAVKSEKMKAEKRKIMEEHRETSATSDRTIEDDKNGDDGEDRIENEDGDDGSNKDEGGDENDEEGSPRRAKRARVSADPDGSQPPEEQPKPTVHILPRGEDGWVLK